jgi:hypothetical protein
VTEIPPGLVAEPSPENYFRLDGKMGNIAVDVFTMWESSMRARITL